ncbi:MAG: hypothetical protein RLN81_02125 [Balneolaceae bacterium]
MYSKILFDLLTDIFWGFVICIVIGVTTSLIVWYTEVIEIFQLYIVSFTYSFNGIIAGGLAIGTALYVYKSQLNIIEIIEGVFSEKELLKTDYYKYKGYYLSIRRSLTFMTEFIIISFAIFYISRFPFKGVPEYFMIFFACLQYALGVYVGRKLYFIGQMVRSLVSVKAKKNLFYEDKLGDLITYVNILSTLTIICTYVNVTSYYSGPFLFDTVLKSSLHVFLLLPAVIATPVLIIFNFYPRSVVRVLYSKSISKKIKELKKKLTKQKIPPFEKMSYLIEYDRLSNDELKYRLRMTLSDLPIAITIVIMLIDLMNL